MTIHVTPPASPAIQSPPASGSELHATNETYPSSRMAWIGLAAVVVLGVLVFWAYEALPFQDLPAHAGLIAMRHRYGASPFEERFYVLAPHIGPYSVFRFLGEVFVRIGGPLFAVRALATLPVIATPLAMLFARRRLYGDTSPTYGFLGVSLSFGIMTLLGFASYLLGVAVMLVGLTLWLDLLATVDDGDVAGGPTLRKREIVMTLFAPLMFVAHGHAFLLFLLCAAISTVITGKRRERIWRLRALTPSLLLAGWVAWIERGTTAPPGSVPQAPQLVPVFQGLYDKFTLLISPTLMTRTGIDFFIGVLLITFAFVCTIYTVRSIRTRATVTESESGFAPRDVRHSRALYACAAAIAIVFVILPHSVGWFGFVDGRLVPLFLILALLGVRRAALPRPLTLGMQYAPPVFASAIAVLALVASYRFQDEATGYKEVLAKVPAESTLLNLPIDPNSDVFTVHPFIHYDKLALVDRPLVVSDVWFHQGSALYPTPQNPALRLPETYSESNLKTIDWREYHLEDWDFVLVRTRPNAPRPYTPDALTLEDHRGGWWLFRASRTAK